MDNLAADFEINPNNPLNAEYELGEGAGFDCSFELYASGTVWGSIDGDINNQTDLINLLNTKVDLTSFEELSQTVTNNYNELSGDITNLTGTVTDNYNTLSGQISNLTTTVNDNYTSLDNRLTTAEGSILDLTDTVSNNYTELDGKITATNNNLSTLSQTVQDNNTAINNRVDGIVESFDADIEALDNRITTNSNNISSLQNTINTYGDIVTYNAAYFATANQGALADTALQPNDNISELVNDVGYITSASLPTVNNATITIQKNGANVGTFTLNQANNGTLNITVPTQASDIGAMPDTTTIEDLTTTAQLNALNSGATTSNIGQITTNQNNIADIRSLIPLQASTSNQLADKGFVNSSIATNTANFIGTFNSVAELEAYTGTLTNNDYAFVATTDTAGNTLYDRYKYNVDTQQWKYEYELNNSSFTAQQWASINSGITSSDVTLIGTALQPNDNISELTNDAGYITSASLPTVNNGTLDIQVNGTSVGTFTANQSGNTTANIVVPDSATWGNITGTLSNQIDLQNALNSKYDASNPDGYITSADLPTNYVTTDTDQSISGTKTFRTISVRNITNASNTTILRTYAGNTEVGTTNTSLLLKSNLTRPYFNNKSNTLALSSDIPTVNNGTLDIQVNGTSVGTFTANQSGNTTANIVVPDSATWGNISGTLSNQTDLQNALNLKVNSSDLATVATTGSYTDLTNKPYVTTNTGITYVGGDSSASTSGTALGYSAKTTGVFGISIGRGAKSKADYAYQIGLGNNTTSYSLSVGFGSAKTYTLLDGNTGLIPDARLSSNIARTSQIPTAISDLTDDTATYPIDKAESVVDNNSGNLKFWSGTKAQYDAIATKDANTLYNITDDSNPTLSMLELLYPVGSIYIGTMSACPLQTLGVGTWQLVATDRVLQGAGTRGLVGTTINESLPNITGNIYAGNTYGASIFTSSYGFAQNGSNSGWRTSTLQSTVSGASDSVTFDASRSSSAYQDNAPVQQDAYLVNIWERIS